MKSYQVDGLTCCFNLLKNFKKMNKFFFCKFVSIFCQQRNVAASSAQNLGVWFFLAEIFEKSHDFFSFLMLFFFHFDFIL